MTRRLTSTALWSVAAALVLGACGVGAEDEARPVPVTERVPTSSPTELPVDPDEADTIAATVYLVDHDGLLHPVSRSVPAHADPAAHLKAVLASVLEGPTATEIDAGLRSAVPASVSLNGVSVTDGVVAIDVSRGFESVGGGEELLASAQLVLAVTAVPGVDRARLLLDGTPSRVPVPGGSLVTGPVTRGDYLELLAS